METPRVELGSRAAHQFSGKVRFGKPQHNPAHGRPDARSHNQQKRVPEMSSVFRHHAQQFDYDNNRGHGSDK